MERCRNCFSADSLTRYKVQNWGPHEGIVTHLKIKCGKCGKSWHQSKLSPEEMNKLPLVYSKSYIKQFGAPVPENQRSLF